MKKHLLTQALVLSNQYRTLKRFVFLIIGLSPILLYSQQTYTFTTCGNSGRFGPSQTQVNNTYTNTNLMNAVVSVNGVQTWTVPQTGNYRITAAGAQGG